MGWNTWKNRSIFQPSNQEASFPFVSVLRNTSRTIEFYRTKDGKCPTEEFLDSLNDKEVQKVLWTLRLIERLDRIPSKYFRKLVNADEIWECRVSTYTGTYRFFSFFFNGNRLIVTHGYSKKTQKTDPKEIRRAEKYRQEFLSRHKEGRK